MFQLRAPGYTAVFDQGEYPAYIQALVDTLGPAGFSHKVAVVEILVVGGVLPVVPVLGVVGHLVKTGSWPWGVFLAMSAQLIWSFACTNKAAVIAVLGWRTTARRVGLVCWRAGDCRWYGVMQLVGMRGLRWR